MQRVATDRLRSRTTNWKKCQTKCFASPPNPWRGCRRKQCSHQYCSQSYARQTEVVHLTEFQTYLNWSPQITLNVFSVRIGWTFSYREKATMFWMTHFTLTRHDFMCRSYVNSKNSRLWSTEEPHALHQTPMHDQKICAWVAISRRRIIGPSFFRQTISSERRCDVSFAFVAL
jgi:hypothetical protein